LKNKLDDLCPVSIALDHTNQADRVMRVPKYLGEIQNLSKPMPFAIRSGKGFVLPSDQTPVPPPPVPAASVGNRAPTQPPAKPAAPTPTKKPIAFSSVVRMPE